MPKKNTSDSSTPGDVAKAIGTTAGKIGTLTGAKSDPEVGRKPPKGKLAKKNKNGLPRKLKKAFRKKVASQEQV